MLYSSSLTDREWKIIEPLLQKKRTKPPTLSKREILGGVLSQLNNRAASKGNEVASSATTWGRVERSYYASPLSVKSERAIFTALGFRKS